MENWSTTHHEWRVVSFSLFEKGTPDSLGVGLEDPIRRHSRSNGAGAASAHLAAAQQMRTRTNCSDDRSTQSIRNNSSARTAISSSSRMLTSCSLHNPVRQEDNFVRGTALAAVAGSSIGFSVRLNIVSHRVPLSKPRLLDSTSGQNQLLQHPSGE